jgi:hypothetical protein
VRIFRDPVFDVVAVVLLLTTCAFFAVAPFGAIFVARLGGQIDVQRVLASPESLKALPAAAHAGVVDAVAQALQTVFLVAAPVAALGLLVVLLLREVPLRGAMSFRPPPRPSTKLHQPIRERVR